MSAERLRQAAQMLRELASEEPQPWPCRSYIKSAVRHVERNCEIECSHGVWNETAERWDDPGCPQPDGHWDRYTTGAYIATMHPGVGLALADWLDATGAIWAIAAASGDNPLRADGLPYKVDGVASALAVADAILGGRP